MNSFLKFIKISLLLVGLLAILIILPASLFGVLAQWQVIILAISYFCFFLPTVWRTVKYGEFATRRDDRQVQSFLGRLA
jgi:hypothetical protein